MSTSTKEPSAKRKSGDDAPTPQKKLSPQTISYLKDWIMSPEHMVRDINHCHCMVSWWYSKCHLSFDILFIITSPLISHLFLPT